VEEIVYLIVDASPSIFTTNALIDQIEIYSPMQSVMLQVYVEGTTYLLNAEKSEGNPE